MNKNITEFEINEVINIMNKLLVYNLNPYIKN